MSRLFDLCFHITDATMQDASACDRLLSSLLTSVTPGMLAACSDRRSLYGLYHLMCVIARLGTAVTCVYTSQHIAIAATALALCAASAFGRQSAEQVLLWGCLTTRRLVHGTVVAVSKPSPESAVRVARCSPLLDAVLLPPCTQCVRDVIGDDAFYSKCLAYTQRRQRKLPRGDKALWQRTTTHCPDVPS